MGVFIVVNFLSFWCFEVQKVKGYTSCKTKSNSMVLTSLDLFSGIGGLTLALEGIARPVMYCDKDVNSQLVLKELMRRGKLPRAPVHDDITTLRMGALPRGIRNVDMIMGGFPCIGFSPVGKREGFENEQSNLYRHIVRLVDELAPKMVFLENVPDVLRLGMHDICNDFGKRGYELRWITLTAKQFGAPQTRKRWFCLALKPGVGLKVKSGFKSLIRWDAEIDPRHRMTLDAPSQNKVRAGLLGNSVVPCCVRYAFEYLLGGFEAPKNTVKNTKVDQSRLRLHKESKFARQGCLLPDRGGVYEVLIDKTYKEKERTIDIMLDPYAYTIHGAKASDKQTSPRVTMPLKLLAWATPRHGMVMACNVLSERSSRDLPTQVRFEVQTPNRLRGGVINARFVEWLMGFEQDWTRQTE